MKQEEKDNTGYWNTGNWNTGNWNTGDRNTGNWNTGNWNTGDRNTGNWNTGDRNTGNWNTGNWNTGNWNTGDRNTGYRNTGDRNTGNRNTGDWNTGYRNTGYFNIDTPKVRIFGKETDIKREDINFPSYLYFELTEWIEFDDMTKEEKENNSFAEYALGYLKVFEYKQAFKNSFDEAEIEDVKKTLDLPNFDYDIFEEVSGITKQDFDNKLTGDVFKFIDGKKYKLVEANK